MHIDDPDTGETIEINPLDDLIRPAIEGIREGVQEVFGERAREHNVSVGTMVVESAMMLYAVHRMQRRAREGDVAKTITLGVSVLSMRAMWRDRRLRALIERQLDALIVRDMAAGAK